jgi:hypothetical protein
MGSSATIEEGLLYAELQLQWEDEVGPSILTKCNHRGLIA